MLQLIEALKQSLDWTAELCPFVVIRSWRGFAADDPNLMTLKRSGGEGLCRRTYFALAPGRYRHEYEAAMRSCPLVSFLSVLLTSLFSIYTSWFYICR
jgi:hypothetical protein